MKKKSNWQDIMRAANIANLSNSSEIDFDNDVNSVLLKMCREGAGKNFEGCDKCSIKFKCWTFRSQV